MADKKTIKKTTKQPKRIPAKKFTFDKVLELVKAPSDIQLLTRLADDLGLRLVLKDALLFEGEEPKGIAAEFVTEHANGNKEYYLLHQGSLFRLSSSLAGILLNLLK